MNSTPADDEDYSSSDESQEDESDYCKGGYHPVQISDMYNERYVVVRKLGWGHFSTVWLAWDVRGKTHVAIKVVKSDERYTEAAADEIQLLEKVRSLKGAQSSEYVMQMTDSFRLFGPNGTHYCMVFEVLGNNLLKLISRHEYQGLPIICVKRIIKQVLLGLEFLHDKCHIIHTDIKPENVLLCVDRKHVQTLAKLPLNRRSDVSAISKVDPFLDFRGAAANSSDAADGKMTKNQKKKLKKKQKKAAAAASTTSKPEEAPSESAEAEKSVTEAADPATDTNTPAAGSEVDGGVVSTAGAVSNCEDSSSTATPGLNGDRGDSVVAGGNDTSSCAVAGARAAAAGMAAPEANATTAAATTGTAAGDCTLFKSSPNALRADVTVASEGMASTGGCSTNSSRGEEQRAIQADTCAAPDADGDGVDDSASAADGTSRDSSVEPVAPADDMEAYMDDVDNISVKIADLGNACWTVRPPHQFPSILILVPGRKFD
ncbi:SRSF protein kinase 1-like [Sycon ciliatum]|uniref:SRSF protein kinase 1-like n=1 Tax=Sycon ciliatum TaxID=27933 RepID=UPI0031F6E085